MPLYQTNCFCGVYVLSVPVTLSSPVAVLLHSLFLKNINYFLSPPSFCQLSFVMKYSCSRAHPASLQLTHLVSTAISGDNLYFSLSQSPPSPRFSWSMSQSISISVCWPAAQEYIRRQLEEEQRQLEILQQQLLQEQALLLVTIALPCATTAPPHLCCVAPISPLHAPEWQLYGWTDCTQRLKLLPTDFRKYLSESCLPLMLFSFYSNSNCMYITIKLAGSQRIPRRVQKSCFVSSICVCPHKVMTSKKN